MSNDTIAWLLVVVFMIHDFEEIIFLAPWLQRHRAELDERLPAFAAKMVRQLEISSTGSIAFAAAEEFVILAGLVLYTVMSKDYSFFAALSLTYVIHCATHVVQGLVVRRYVPAIATAVLTGLWCLGTIWFLSTQGLIYWPRALALTPLLVAFIFANLRWALKLAGRLSV